MAYKIKSNVGRKRVSYKLRSAEGITPKGFSFQRYDRKSKSLVYKREK